jgi:2-aminoadipate transaminase
MLTAEYKLRFNLMAAQLNAYMPKDVIFHQPAGGLNFWLTLPRNMSAQTLYEEAIERQIIFAPGQMFYLRQPEENCLRLSIAAVKPEQIELGIQVLAQLITRRLQKNQSPSQASENYQDQIL